MIQNIRARVICGGGGGGGGGGEWGDVKNAVFRLFFFIAQR